MGQGDCRGIPFVVVLPAVSSAKLCGDEQANAVVRDAVAAIGRVLQGMRTAARRSESVSARKGSVRPHAKR
jgi:hypothetical protein